MPEKCPHIPVCHQFLPPQMMHPPIWDDVIDLSEKVTTGCNAALHTTLLYDDAKQTPLAINLLAMDSLPCVGVGLVVDAGKKMQVQCTIAFVLERNLLVQQLKLGGDCATYPVS